MLSKKKKKTTFVAVDENLPPDDEHYEAIVNYIENNNLDRLKKFMNVKNLRVDDRNENGTTGLMVAAEKNNVESAEILLSHKADPNGEDLDGWTPLTYSARYGSSDVCKILLVHKADVNHKDTSNFTPLVWAAYYDHGDTVRLLIEYGANMEFKDGYGLNALMFACGRNNVEVVKELLEFGAKVNTKDKFGTTPIVYASRKGYNELVSMLIEAGAGLDYRGIYGWTALLLAVRENLEDTVQILLKRKQNINVTDKLSSNRTPLMIACRKGNANIVRNLLSVGANLNLQDDNKNTALIYAAKGRHFEIVNMLMQNNVDINVCGDENKTAIFIAVDTGDLPIINLLLSKRPDLEIASVHGNTPLLRAVRNRNLDVVQLLLLYHAKASAVNKKGDNVLHVALRARSKLITEALLHDPKNAHLLYHPNKAGETPYNLDHQEKKPILEEVFGALKLSKVEQMKNSEMYNLYNDVLTEILSEPNLSLPICVGIYANWSSGKSIFLEMITERMQEFAANSIQPSYPFVLIFTLTFVHLMLFIGFFIIPIVYKVLTKDWLSGIYFGLISNFLLLILIGVYAFVYWWKHYKWMVRFNGYTSKKLYGLNLALQVLFLHQPPKNESNNKFRQVRFIFVGRKAKLFDAKETIIHFINVLNWQIELEYGWMVTRLYRALRPKPNDKKKHWTFRKFLKIPTFLIVEIALLCVFIMISLGVELNVTNDSSEQNIAFIVTSCIFAFLVLVHICSIVRVLFYLIIPTRYIIKWKFFTGKQQLETEGIYVMFQREIELIIRMLACLDECSKQQTRIVITSDELKMCDNEKELIILDLFKLLFLEGKEPFIVLLMTDPNIIQKAIAKLDKNFFQNANLNVQDFLRSFVNLPICLRNIRRHFIEQAEFTSKSMYQRRKWSAKKSISITVPNSSANKLFENSSYSSLNSFYATSRSFINQSKEQVTNQGNVHMAEDNFFNTVNPRTLRTLMNLLYFTSRLLKYYRIEFNWYHLVNWIFITYQWPFRMSFLIVYVEFNSDLYDNNVSLKDVYNDVKNTIPNDVKLEPFLNLDEEAKKFNIYISYHERNLSVADLKIFYPFTIHLDKTLQTYIQNRKFHMFYYKNENTLIDLENDKGTCACAPNSFPSPIYLFTLPPELLRVQLSSLKVHDICVLFDKLDDLTKTSLTRYNDKIIENNINGKVLLHCNMEELKTLLNMNFGNWEMFRTLINELRYSELTCYKPKDIKPTRPFDFHDDTNDSKASDGTKETDLISQSKRVNFDEPDENKTNLNRDESMNRNEHPEPLMKSSSMIEEVIENKIFSSIPSKEAPDESTENRFVDQPSTTEPKSLIQTRSEIPPLPISKTFTNHEMQTNIKLSPDDIGFIVGTVVGRVKGQVSGRMMGSSSSSRGRSKIKIHGRSIGKLSGHMKGTVKGSIKQNITP